MALTLGGGDGGRFERGSILDDGAIPRGLWPIGAGTRRVPDGGECFRRLNGERDGDLGRRRSGDRGRDGGDRLRDGDARFLTEGCKSM